MAVAEDYGKIDILVHSLSNGTEVTKPHLEMSHKGYLVASLASAYLVVSLLNKFVLIMNTGGACCPSPTSPQTGSSPGKAAAYLASRPILSPIPYKAGRKCGVHLTTVSVRPFKLRAASDIEKEAGKKTFIKCAIDCSNLNAPLVQDLYNNGGSLRTDPDHAVCGHQIHGSSHGKLV